VIPEPWLEQVLPLSISSPQAVTTQQDDIVINDREESCASKPAVRCLPDFSRAHEPNFWLDDLAGPTACKKIVDYYREAVHWKRNLFDLPSNHRGRASQLARLFNTFGLVVRLFLPHLNGKTV